MDTEKNTIVIIPVFNEEDCIAQVIAELKRVVPTVDLLVVNDASTDSSAEIIDAIEGVFCIHLPINLGIGGCVQTGFRFAFENQYDYALQFDGDGQHNAHDIPLLLEQLENSTADVVIGSRFVNKTKGYTSSWSRRLGIKILRTVAQSLGHVNLTDCTSGFRAYNQRAFSFLAFNYPRNFPEPEAIVLLGRNHFTLREIPTDIRARIGGKSSISSSNSLFYMVRVILGMVMTTLRPKIDLYE